MLMEVQDYLKGCSGYLGPLAYRSAGGAREYSYICVEDFPLLVNIVKPFLNIQPVFPFFTLLNTNLNIQNIKKYLSNFFNILKWAF